MTYLPDLRVRIDGADTALDVLEPVSIRRGRDTIDSQAQAGYATLSLFDPDADTPPPRLTAQVTIDVDNGSGSWHRLFTGQISDTRTEVISAGDLSLTAVHTVTAVGPLGSLHRGFADPSGYPQQLDGDRIAAIFQTAATVLWEVAQGSWAEQDGTWAEYGTPLAVDQPGTYLLAPVDPSDDQDPWQLVQQAANDGLGQLGETRNGGLTYDASRGRLQRVIDTGYTELPAVAVGAMELSSSSSVVDLVNEVTVAWSGGEVTARDPDAVEAVGAVLSREVATELDDQDDAEARAARLLALYSRPARSLESIVVHADNDDLDPTKRAAIYDLDLSSPVRLDGLPAAIARRVFTGFVEAITWSITRTRATVQLAVSDYRLSEFSVAWGDLDATAWDATDPAITWNTAQELVDA